MKQSELDSTPESDQSSADKKVGRRIRTVALAGVYTAGIALSLAIAYFSLVPIFDISSSARYDPKLSVSLQEPDGEITVPSKQVLGETLRVAIAPVISPENSLEEYDALVSYLAKGLNRKPITIHRGSYAETNEFIRNRRCDVALVCTYAFVRGEKEFGMQLLAAPKINGVALYYSYIIAPSSSAAQSLLDFRDKIFASADLMSNSGWLYPAKWLMDRKEDPLKFFSQHIITGSHDHSVAAVADGLVDGAAVDSIVYDQMLGDNPPLASQTRIVSKSPRFGMPPLVVHPNMDPQLRAKLQELLLTMQDNQDGSAVLERLGFDQFIEPHTTDYDAIREAAAYVESVACR